MLQTVGVDNVLSVDLQRPGQGHEACFFDCAIPVETVSTNSAFAEYFKNNIHPPLKKVIDSIIDSFIYSFIHLFIHQLLSE
jgi:phosphoribosylpyrophosphate synthetase